MKKQKINAPASVLGGSPKNSENLPESKTGSFKKGKPIEDASGDQKGGSVEQHSDSEPPKITKFSPPKNDKPKPNKFS